MQKMSPAFREAIVADVREIELTALPHGGGWRSCLTRR